MAKITLFSRDRLSPHERFRRMIRALAAQDTPQIQTLQQVPRVMWEGPDPAFTERLRVAEILVRSIVADLELTVTKITLLTAFEKTLRDFDAVVQDEMGLAWSLGWEAAGGEAHDNMLSCQDRVLRLQEACRIPELFSTTISELRGAVANQWRGWTDFTHATWRMAGAEPIQAWFGPRSSELLATVRTHTQPDPEKAKAYRHFFDERWSNALTMIGGVAHG